MTIQERIASMYLDARNCIDPQLIVPLINSTKKRYNMGIIDDELASIELDVIKNKMYSLGTSIEYVKELQAENARLRYELELLKNPAEKDLHDQLSKAVDDSINAAAAALEKTKKDLKK